MSRRTVADAVESLRRHTNFCKNTRSTIHTAPLRLPSGDIPFLVQLVCEDVGVAVSLPTCNRFRAKLAHSSTTTKFEEWETPLLEGAVVEIIGDQVQVVLSDGRRLRGVEIIPSHMPPHLDRPREVQSIRLQRAVVGHIVRMNRAEDRCYRCIHKDSLPRVRALDFSTLHVLRLPSLSAIVHDIDLNNAQLNSISRQTVANILRDCGLRLPESRRCRG